MPRRMRNDQLRLDMHRDSLRRDTACPKYRNLPFMNRNRIAEVGFCNVLNTDGFGMSDMNLLAVDGRKP